MKTFAKIILAVSAACNIALAIMLVRGVSSSAGAGSSDDKPANSASASAAKATTDTAQTWTKLQSDDLATFVQHLRDNGFPPNLIRAILAAQIRERFAAQRKAIEGDSQGRDYWLNAATDPGKQTALRNLGREEQKMLRELLGPDADAGDVFGQLFRDRGLAGIPAGKLDDVRQILRDFTEQRQDLMASLSIGGVISLTAADSAKLKAIEDAQHAELAKVLTPAELELYDLTASRSAQGLRNQLSAFNPSEDEFRALFKLQQAFDDKYGQMAGYNGNQDEMRARMTAQKQLQDQMKAALAPDRAAEFDRATDFNYRQTTQLVARLELPPETANQLYAVQKEFEQKRNDTMQEVSQAMREAAQTGVRPNMQLMTDRMTALQQEALSKVTPILGNDRAVEAYKQYGGSWIGFMVPRLPTTTRPPASSGATAPATKG
jgi:hypothetical protein